MSTIRMMIIPESTQNKDGHIQKKYSAIGLEHFIGAQGDTPELASRAFGFVLTSTIAACRAMGLKPLEGIAPAPVAYFEAFDRGLHEQTYSVPDAEYQVQQRCSAA